MASHVIDNLLLQNSFGTGEMRGIWDEKNRLQKQLDVERALAEAEGELNVIPKEAAATIASVANSNLFDLQKLAQAGLTSKHSLIASDGRFIYIISKRLRRILSFLIGGI